MKVLLISPPFYRILGFYNRYFPYGLATIAAVLKNSGHKCFVYDADSYDRPLSLDYSQMSSRYPIYLESFKDPTSPIWQEVKKTIKKHKPDIIGISTYTPFAASAFFVAKIAKSIFPSIKIVIGGPHAAVKSQEILEICSDVDYVISGEGEETMKELVEHLESKKILLSSIKGLSYRQHQKIIKNIPRPRIKNLDLLPPPDRSLLLQKHYSSEDMGLVMTSRGCPYHCTYCASTKGTSYRSIDNIIQEIVDVQKKYGTVQFTFKDDSFTLDSNRIQEFCQKLIDLKIKIKWECNTRVNLINKDLLSLMKKAGCNFIKIGIESGSDRILKLIDKGITLDQIYKGAKLLNQSKIHWSGYFMMGVVGETEADIYNTVNLLKKIKPNLAIISTYEPYPGTVMFQQGVEKNILKNNMTLSEFYTLPPHHYYRVDPKIPSDAISPQNFFDLEKKVLDIFHRYNTQPRNVLSLAFSKFGVYLKEPKVLFSDIDKYCKYTFSHIEKTLK